MNFFYLIFFKFNSFILQLFSAAYVCTTDLGSVVLGHFFIIPEHFATISLPKSDVSARPMSAGCTIEKRCKLNHAH